MIFLRTLVVLVIVLAGLSIFFYPNIFGDNLRQNVKGAGLGVDKFYHNPTRVYNFSSPPEISAKSAVVIDSATGALLYNKDGTSRLLPASITKLATALVALESCTPDQLVIVDLISDEPMQMGLARGDIVTVETLLYGLLVTSGNDAAYALAGACAESIDQFVIDMNQKAKKLGMVNTHFSNPAGFDDIVQYSTAFDLARLAKAAVGDPLIAKIVATKSIVLNDTSGIKTYYLSNVNKLIGEVEGIEGIKTGRTDGAQENLITKTTRDNETIITVVLGSEDRFADSKKMIEWTFGNWRWDK